MIIVIAEHLLTSPKLFSRAKLTPVRLSLCPAKLHRSEVIAGPNVELLVLKWAGCSSQTCCCSLNFVTKIVLGNALHPSQQFFSHVGTFSWVEPAASNEDKSVLLKDTIPHCWRDSNLGHLGHKSTLYKLSYCALAVESSH